MSKIPFATLTLLGAVVLASFTLAPKVRVLSTFETDSLRGRQTETYCNSVICDSSLNTQCWDWGFMCEEEDQLCMAFGKRTFTGAETCSGEPGVVCDDDPVQVKCSEVFNCKCQPLMGGLVCGPSGDAIPGCTDSDEACEGELCDP